MKNNNKPMKTSIMTKILRYAFPAIVLLLLWLFLGKTYKTGLTLREVDSLPSSTVLGIPVVLPDFSLSDHNGKKFTQSNFRKNWTFMFFGYTHCPDVCPMALVDLNGVYNTLADKNTLVERRYGVGTQFVLVTVDPERDSVEELKEYIPYFNENFIGLTGRPEMIDSIARPMGVAYRRVPAQDLNDDYLVDHSSSFMLIDPLGRLRATFPPPHDPATIADEYIKIRSVFTAECCISGPEILETVIFDYRKGEK